MEWKKIKWIKNYSNGWVFFFIQTFKKIYHLIKLDWNLRFLFWCFTFKIFTYFSFMVLTMNQIGLKFPRYTTPPPTPTPPPRVTLTSSLTSESMDWSLSGSYTINVFLVFLDFRTAWIYIIEFEKVILLRSMGLIQ